ncbi:MAG: hypothetical protein HY051_00795, partial [Candidatus Aenigmarchaeota archaeon]|nr:hypothetical protein [Candidatus Aenigmarchaeota archaeon]
GPVVANDKQSVVWRQTAKKGGQIMGNSPNAERAQSGYNYNVWDCDPADNTDTAGYNAFCNSKSSSAPYCDPTLKKCEPCSIVNNIGYDAAKTPIENSGKSNPTDCPASNNPPDFLVIGKCNLDTTPPGATKGGSCQFASTCDVNLDCTSSCCSAVTQTSGPGRIIPQALGNKCISPSSSNNPMSSLISPINSYLCKSA